MFIQNKRKIFESTSLWNSRSLYKFYVASLYNTHLKKNWIFWQCTLKNTLEVTTAGKEFILLVFVSHGYFLWSMAARVYVLKLNSTKKIEHEMHVK